jgi:chondroitin AC lyase
MKAGYSRRDMLKTSLAASAALLAPSPLFASTGEVSPAAIVRIRERYVASVLPTGSSRGRKLKELGEQYAETLTPGGSWSDVDYEGKVRSNWRTAEHLNRTRMMARVAVLEHKAGHPAQALDAKVLRALKYWTLHDYQNPNWWWNQIGVPRLAGEIAFLMQPQLSREQLSKVVEIMKRSNWRKGPWTGANLTWGVAIEIVRGCLEENAGTVAEGYRRMYQEIRIVSPEEEGIQQDSSFHQHGPQLYNGGYGLAYAIDVGRFVAFAWGTVFQIPADKMAILSSYLLDGQQWLVRGDIIDYSTVGREITRKGKLVAPGRSTESRHSIAGPGESFPGVVAMLASMPTPRQKELRAFSARLQQRKNAPAFTGNKQFWCSDFMAHRWEGFYTSVKMLSNRMLNGEEVNQEGKKSQHLSDGVNLLYLTGDEYNDIFPVWDWTKLPGTTAIQDTLEIGGDNPIHARGTTTFAGGVSDGEYGMAAMDLARGKLTAKKAWFFFDDAYLCLGAGIHLADDTEHSVATDVNQTLLAGDVLTSQSQQPLVEGAHSYQAGKIGWVYHDGVGYIPGPGNPVSLTAGPQTGTWREIGTGSSKPVTLPVFNLWIDHGHAPRAGSYQYSVLSGASVKRVAARARSPVTHVLSNQEDTQAVWHSELKIVMAALRKPGFLVTPIGRLEVDHSCLLLARKTAGGWKITASNPENQPLTLHVGVGSRKIAIDLPGGNFAGSSVTSIVPATRAASGT